MSATFQDDPRSREETGAGTWWSSDLALAFALALLVVVAALWRPLTSCATHTMGDWIGLGIHFPLLAIDGPASGSNAGGGDPLRQFIPWAQFAGAELRAGRAPLWNPYSGNGVPLLANFQSALCSPFTLLHYALPLKWALLGASALRLIASTVGSLLFLRSLRRSRFAASFGAVSYAMAGFHLGYPLHPHTAVLALVPFALLAVERAAQSFEARPDRLPRARLAALALALGAMVLAGHPESLLFGVYLVALYAGVRLMVAARRAPPARALAFALATLAAGLLGGALGAVQLAPFVEYMLRSAAVAAAGREVAVWSWNDLLIQVLPDAFGHVVGAQWGPGRLLAAANESTAFYTGGSTVLLALGAVLMARLDALTWFFLALCVGMLLYLFDAPLAAELLGPLFGRDYVLASRATALWTMPVCALAAFTIDRMRQSACGATQRRAWSVVLLGGALIGLCRWSMHAKLQALREAEPLRFDALEPGDVLQLEVQSAAALIVLGAVLVLAVRTRPRWGRLAVALALSGVVLQSVLGYSRFLPVSPDRFAQATAPAAVALAAATGGERVVLLSSRGLPPNINLNYGITLATSYDALELRELDELRGRLFGYRGYGGLTLRASRRALDLFGVRYVATPGDWLPLDTERAHRLAQDGDARWTLGPELARSRESRARELNASSPAMREEFTCSKPGFDGLVVHFLESASAARTVRLELIEAQSRASIAVREVRLEQLRELGGGRLECILDFAPQPHSEGRRYELALTAERLAAGESVRVLLDRWGPRPEATGGGARGRARDRVVLDLSYGRADFERVGQVGPMVLHRYLAGRGNAWIAAEVCAVDDNDAALERVLDGEFDPRSQVVLERAVETSDTGPEPFTSELRLLERTPLGSRWTARCSRPAHLVLAQAHYPGWVARVDGAPAEVLRANVAFDAIALPAGESEIELTYAPASVRIGMWGSLAALVCIAWAGWPRRSAPSPAPRS